MAVNEVLQAERMIQLLTFEADANSINIRLLSSPSCFVPRLLHSSPASFRICSVTVCYILFVFFSAWFCIISHFFKALFHCLDLASSMNIDTPVIYSLCISCSTLWGFHSMPSDLNTLHQPLPTHDFSTGKDFHNSE